MKKMLSLVPVTCQIFSLSQAFAFASERDIRPFSEVVGIYHWGGRRTKSMAEGVEGIAALHAHIARVSLSARYREDYNQDTHCVTPFSLSAAAQEVDVRDALGNPHIDVLILTAYDGVSFPDCATPLFLNPS